MNQSRQLRDRTASAARKGIVPETLIWPPVNHLKDPVSMSQSLIWSKSRSHRSRERAKVPQNASVCTHKNLRHMPILCTVFMSAHRPKRDSQPMKKQNLSVNGSIEINICHGRRYRKFESGSREKVRILWMGAGMNLTNDSRVRWPSSGEPLATVARSSSGQVLTGKTRDNRYRNKKCRCTNRMKTASNRRSQQQASGQRFCLFFFPLWLPVVGVKNCLTQSHCV